MIEATCAACGTVNRIAEADVPVGAKFVSCTSCKSKVPLPAAKATAVPAPAKPAAAAKPIGIPAIPPKLPTPPKGVPASKAGAPAELADLPAPKRQSPLAGVEPSKPAPRSALAGAELPVPKGMPKPPAPQTGSLDLDDLMPPAEPAGLADLPAPKARASALADLPAPKAAPKSALADLPAPKRKTPPAGLPAQSATLADLPAPKRKTPPVGVPAALELGDLPAPKGPVGLTDLPAPKAAPGGGTLDLDDDLDLPMPKAGVTDLPTPKPGANNDLPAPKGFFDDLPQPAKKGAGGSIDLPAPKGFFDDLPQPAKSSPTQDIAPKGFFDDLPQPARSSPSQDLAPKGLFDDLPHPAPAKGGAGGGGSLFDDLPQPPGKSAANAAMGAGDLDLGPMNSPGLELDTGGPSLDLDMGGGGGGASAGPELDSGLPLGEGAFQDLDLSEPSKPKADEEASPIKIKTPAKGAAPKTPIQINVPPAKGSDVSLDLADDPHEGKKGKPAAAAAAGGAKITAKKKPGQTEDTPEARAAKRKRSQIMLGAVLGVVALGGGGFYFYQRHTKAQQKADAIAADLAKAQKALEADDDKHWQRAKAAADEALALDATDPRAIGIAAEASCAGALDNGQNRDARIAQCRKLIQDALGAGRTSPEIARATAVKAIVEKGQAGRAVDLLRAEIGKDPKDGWLQLYMGWAQLAKGDAAEAIKAFDQAIAMTPGTKLPALYGKGEAKLMMADTEGAKDAFGKVLEIKKDHVCANIGLIATRPASETIQKVAELEAVLALKDINSADPRCRVHAITLIGDVHRAAGRLDMARSKYGEALKLQANDVPTLDGLAAVELRDGKTQVAQDYVGKALAVNADDADALMLQAELMIKAGKLPDAEAQIGKLADRKPPLPTLAQARLHVVRGKLLEAKGQPEAAIDEYAEGSKLAGEQDLTPTMLAVTRLADLAKKEADPSKADSYRKRADALLQAFADKAQDDSQLSAAIGGAYLEAGDPVKAETFLRRSVAMKGDDPLAKLQLAKALEAQQKTDDAVGQLKEAQTLDPKSIDIALELAKTYQNGGRDDDAVKAYDVLLAAAVVPLVARADGGRYFARLGLARKAAGLIDDANKLLDKAVAQSEPILKEEPDNPAGLYLKGEGLLKAKKPEEAVPTLTRASDNDPDVQYFDALGRALEARIPQDTKFIESARFAYERASKADPKVIDPWVGQGRMLILKREFDAAIKALVNAVALDKTSSEIAYNMGVAYYGLRTNEAYKKPAAQWLEQALKGRPELDLQKRANTHYMLGDLYDNSFKDKAAEAARNYDTAVRLGEQIEKETGATPDWPLTETYYELGDLYYKLGNKVAQKAAWQRYVDRKPKPSVRLSTAQQALLTQLKSY